MPTHLSSEELKQIVRSGLDSMNRRDFSYIENDLLPEVTLYAPPEPDPRVGHDGYRDLLSMLHTAFPDHNITIEHMVAEGDSVAVRWTVRGTHQGEFLGFPATGRSVEATEFATYQFDGRKISEVRVMPDLVAHFVQLELMPPGPPPKLVRLLIRLAQRRNRRRS